MHDFMHSHCALNTVISTRDSWTAACIDPGWHAGSLIGAGVSFDIQLEVSVVPGPPASWSVAIVDYADGAAVAAGRQGPAGADLSSIACGQPFYLEVEALDACHNR
jgi:hypothetical protein